MSVNHTPGPWMPWPPEGVLDGTQDIVHYPKNGPAITIAGMAREADARLIAAAPDLLRACLLADAYCSQGRDEEVEFEGESYSEPQFLAEVVSNALYDALKKAGIDTKDMGAQEIADIAQSKQQGAGA